ACCASRTAPTKCTRWSSRGASSTTGRSGPGRPTTPLGLEELGGFERALGQLANVALRGPAEDLLLELLLGRAQVVATGLPGLLGLDVEAVVQERAGPRHGHALVLALPLGLAEDDDPALLLAGLLVGGDPAEHPPELPAGL